MGLKKLNILNSILLLTLFAVLAIAANDGLIYKRAVKVIKANVLAVGTEPAKVPITEYASIVENPVFPGIPHRFTPVAPSSMTALGTERMDAGGIKKIRLKGTYVSQKAHSSNFAIFVHTKTGAEKSFRVNDDVFGFGKLISVKNDRVIVKAGTKEFLFYMPETGKPTDFTRKLPARTGRPKTTNVGTEYSKKVSDTEWIINQEAVLDAMDDMSSILSDARMTPLSIGGRMNGFRVTEVKPKGIFDAIGLLNNDIIKRVNNYEMTSPERAIQVLSALRGERNFSIDIERKGKKMSLNYEVR